jgi:hypothetical protein
MARTGAAHERGREGVLDLIDGFILQILSIRKMILIVFASSIILGPPSTALSLYVVTHPAFEKALDSEDNFGEVLLLLLGSTVSVSVLMIIASVKQFKLISSWDRRFKEYTSAQKELEDRIMANAPYAGLGESD